MRRSIAILFAILKMTVSNGQNIIPYQRDLAISDVNGVPKNSSVWYFPVETFRDTSYSIGAKKDSLMIGIHENCGDGLRSKEDFMTTNNLSESQIMEYTRTAIDTSMLNWYSSELYKMNEPVLYNFPLNSEVYRFTWIRAFHTTVVISVIKTNSEILIVTKRIEQYPDEEQFRVRVSCKPLAQKYFNRLKRIACRAKLFEMPHILRRGCVTYVDGSVWILETHDRAGYYYAKRHSPQKNTLIRQIGVYIIEKSDANLDMIY